MLDAVLDACVGGCWCGAGCLRWRKRAVGGCVDVCVVCGAVVVLALVEACAVAATFVAVAANGLRDWRWRVCLCGGDAARWRCSGCGGVCRIRVAVALAFALALLR